LWQLEFLSILAVFSHRSILLRLRSPLLYFYFSFLMGNGAKAQQKRDRNAAKSGANSAKSQMKVNEAAKNILCQTCRQAFLLTTRAPALAEHALNKHSKSMEECFPSPKA